jgi:hypothetical protein
LLSVIFIPSWFPSLPITSTQLLVTGGVLLFFVGLMIGIGRKQRASVSVQRSFFTDELMIYLSRIADAVERQADRPTLPQIAEMIDQRIAEHQQNAEANAAAAGAGAGPKSRAMPFSMFGREVPEKS